MLRGSIQKRFVCITVAAALVISASASSAFREIHVPGISEYVTAYAKTSEELKKQKQELEKEQQKLKDQQKAVESEKAGSEKSLQQANRNINELAGEQQAVGEQIDETNNELIGLLTSIELIQSEIADKKQQIEDTKAEYEEQKRLEEKLYSEMKQRVRFMYEQGDNTYVMLLLQSQSFSELLNKASYVEEIYDYDRKKLAEFMEAKEAALYLSELLEEEKSELETSEYELEEEQAYMEELLAQYRQQYADFDVRLSKARQEAAVYSAQLKAQTAQLKSLQNEINKKQQDIKTVAKAADEAASREAAEKAAKEKKAAEKALKKKNAGTTTADNTTDSPSDTSGSGSASQSESASPKKSYSAPGSATGSNIANYACQFVGNPYVAGGTSLTNGCDCSGFVMSVYAAFGISVPRTSFSQSQAGREVSYENAQAGDVIYYGGHVAIYLGGGRIVHASTPRTGIKYENATYRTILTVRRFI